jgi:hypothetical protein
VRIPTALAADLALLTDALDVGAVDIASSVTLLTSDVAAAVWSYAGLSVRLSSPAGHAELTTVVDEDTIARIVTSLRIPVPTGSPTSDASALIVLYATLPGAFVDLAADLAWLTGRPLGDVGLDIDLGARIHAHPATSLRSLSSINQAVGVLVGRGRTPEESVVELDALADEAGTDRCAAALALLAALPPTGARSPVDAD